MLRFDRSYWPVRARDVWNRTLDPLAVVLLRGLDVGIQVLMMDPFIDGSAQIFIWSTMLCDVIDDYFSAF